MEGSVDKETLQLGNQVEIGEREELSFDRFMQIARECGMGLEDWEQLAGNVAVTQFNAGMLGYPLPKRPSEAVLIMGKGGGNDRLEEYSRRIYSYCQLREKLHVLGNLLNNEEGRLTPSENPPVELSEDRTAFRNWLVQNNTADELTSLAEELDDMFETGGYLVKKTKQGDTIMGRAGNLILAIWRREDVEIEQVVKRLNE